MHYLALLAAVLLFAPLSLRALDASPRENLVTALLSEDIDQQEALVRGLIGADDPWVEQVLAAWRQGGAFIHESGGLRIPFILENRSGGTSTGLRVIDRAPIEGDGTPIRFTEAELMPVDTSSRLRRAIKTALDLFAIASSNPKVRRDAAIKLGQEQNPEYLPYFEQRLPIEKDAETLRALKEAVALTTMAGDSPEARVAAIRQLAELRSINSLSFLTDMRQRHLENPGEYDEATGVALREAINSIEIYLWWGNAFGTAFRGLSLAAVLLVAALGLAITFGLMGVINMAHGELIMVGAYTAYVLQNLFSAWFGPAGLQWYFIPALGMAFLVAGTAGLILERGVIRFLYKRPLESLLATWGVSLVLQQLFRQVFGAANVQVSSPSWLSGSFVVSDVLLAYNRLFVIAFGAFIVLATYLLLTRTSLGLQIRAVMQNRAMASCIGVRTNRVNMLTFAFGSGLAGMAGVCLSQIGNVGPSLGQNYIIDCFMIVVLGGVGNLFGTVFAALGVGTTDQILQPWLGAVMGKITVLIGIILFLQWRPAGIFATRGRALES